MKTVNVEIRIPDFKQDKNDFAKSILNEVTEYNQERQVIKSINTALHRKMFKILEEFHDELQKSVNGLHLSVQDFYSDIDKYRDYYNMNLKGYDDRSLVRLTVYAKSDENGKLTGEYTVETYKTNDSWSKAVWQFENFTINAFLEKYRNVILDNEKLASR